MKICTICFCLIVEMTRFTTSQEYARPSPTDMPYSQRDLINEKEKMKLYLKNLNSFKLLLPPELVKHGCNRSADLWVEDEKIRVPLSGQGISQISKMNLDQNKLNRYLQILDLELAKTPATIHFDPTKIKSYVLNEIMKSKQLSKPVDLVSRSRIKLMKSFMTDRTTYNEKIEKKLQPKGETFYKKDCNQIFNGYQKIIKNLKEPNVLPAEGSLNSDPEMLMTDEQRVEKLMRDSYSQNSGDFDSCNYEPDRDYLVNDFDENNVPLESIPGFNNQKWNFKSQPHLEKNKNDISENFHNNVLSANHSCNEIEHLNDMSISKHRNISRVISTPTRVMSNCSEDANENKDFFLNHENTVQQNYENILNSPICYNGSTKKEQIPIKNQFVELQKPFSYVNASFSYPLEAKTNKENVKTIASIELSPPDKVFSDEISNLQKITNYFSNEMEKAFTNFPESVVSHEITVNESTKSHSLRQIQNSEKNTSTANSSNLNDLVHSGKLTLTMDNINLTNIEGNSKENVGNNNPLPPFQNGNFKQDLNDEPIAPNSLQLYTNMSDAEKPKDTSQVALTTKLMRADNFISNPFNIKFSNLNDYKVTTGYMNGTSLDIASNMKKSAENNIFDAFNKNIFHYSTEISTNTLSSVDTFEIQPLSTIILSKLNSNSSISPNHKVFPLQPNDEIINVPKIKYFMDCSNNESSARNFPTKPAKMYSNYYLSKLKKFEEYRSENDFQNLFDQPLMPLFGTKENEVSKILNVNLEHLHFDKGALYKIIGKALKVGDENGGELAPPKWLENKYDELLHASHRGQTFNQESFNDQDNKNPIYPRDVLINNYKRSGEESLKSKQQILQNKGNMKIENSNKYHQPGM